MGCSAKTWVLAGAALLGFCGNCRGGDFLAEYPQRLAVPLSPGARHSTVPFLPPRTDPPPHDEASRADSPPHRESLAGNLAGANPTGSRLSPRPTLDLRAPDPKLDFAQDAEVPFPSRPRVLGSSESVPASAPAFHFQDSRVKQIAEHFHREGLPVARLWETHSALLSLGLNGRGKPGLWLVQKTH
jgi:hypothetical protein